MNIILIATLTITFLALVSGPLRRNTAWSATVTPLASIIGSGFLVSVPLLASSVGIWAIPAVAALTGLAFLLGGAVRYNIRHGETHFRDHSTGRITLSAETLSHVVLIGAYFISVAYYLSLLATFGLKIVGIQNVLWGKGIATGLIVLIAGIGATKGLGGIEKAEKFTVSANLAAIAALLVILAWFGVALPSGYSWTQVTQTPHTFDEHTLRFLLGLLIIVQGFETTRFMGTLYDAETRVRAMQRAQLISSAVYLVFFVLMVPLFPYFTAPADVAGFIAVIGRVTPWLPFVVTAGAIASQFSAAVADSMGASGLVSDISGKRITPNHAYLLIGLVAILVIWETDVIAIVALASRAFAAFYWLQCLVAVLLARARGELHRCFYYGVLAMLCLVVVIWGIPAGG